MKKLFLFGIVASILAVIAPAIVRAGGYSFGMHTSSYQAGATVELENLFFGTEACEDHSTLTLNRANMKAEGLDGQGQPVDFSQASISVHYLAAGSDTYQTIPGHLENRSSTEISWVAEQPFTFVEFEDTLNLTVNGAKILQPGRAGFGGGFTQVDGNNCLSSIPNYALNPAYLERYILTFIGVAPSPTPSPSPSPTPSPTPTPSPSPTPSPLPVAGLVNPGPIEVTVPRGGSYTYSTPAFSLTSTTATSFFIYGYPTTGSGIFWASNSGSIQPGGSVQIGVFAYSSVPVGTYTGTAKIEDPSNRGVIYFPMTVHVIDTPPALALSYVQATGITTKNAAITWNTNYGATSQVKFGKSPTDLRSTTTVDTSYRTSHRRELSPLSRNTTYYYQVISRSADNQTVTSPVYSFKTPSR